MTELTLTPGSATLADWRAIYRGAVPKLDAACRPKIKASAEAVARILAACPSQKMSTEARVLSKVKPAPQHPSRSAESKTAVPPASAALKYANCATLMGMVDPAPSITRQARRSPTAMSPPSCTTPTLRATATTASHAKRTELRSLRCVLSHGTASSTTITPAGSGGTAPRR